MDPAHTAIGSKCLTDVLDFAAEAADTPPRRGIVACALYRDGRRVRDIVDLRERLTAAFEVSLLLSAARQNDIVKKLGSWAAILAVPTAIAGIYGMNFKYMPELEWSLGYPFALLLMLTICGSLYYCFRRAV
jgi:magnesium transporter